MLALRRQSLMRVASRAGNPIRRMCTAVAEEAPPGPFSLSDPTMQGVLGAFACTYIAVIRWQLKDKALAKEVALHKAAKAPAEPIADLSPIVAAVVEAAAPTGAAPVLSARMAPAAAAAGASPTDWNVGETGAWLHGLELGAHAPAFKTHAVDGKLLLTLTEQDLYSVLNVVSPLHRKKITMGTAACKSGRGRGRLPSRPDSARRPPTRAPRTAQLTCPRLQLTCYRLLTWFPLPAVCDTSPLLTYPLPRVCHRSHRRAAPPPRQPVSGGLAMQTHLFERESSRAGRALGDCASLCRKLGAHIAHSGWSGRSLSA